MKPARNALKGYNYQNYIVTLLLAKMDTERKIVKIVSEALDTKNFDDIYIELSDDIKYRIQVKNYVGIGLSDIYVDTESNIVTIGTNHNKYDPVDNNILVFNSDINESCMDSTFMDIPAIKRKDIILVPLSEMKVADSIEEMYQQESRALQIIQFGYKCISAGKFEITIDDLPEIITFSTDLKNKTVFVRNIPEKIEDGVTHIEGKPGVGKSHYVNELVENFHESIVYRFWTDSQDFRLNDRLRYDVFIEQIGLLVYRSPRSFTMQEIVSYIADNNLILIVDGLDHVENYNPRELNKFISFFDELNTLNCRVLLLSRPMKVQLSWNKKELYDWTFDETSLYLEVAYGIDNYGIRKKIYDITKGYPIITYFLAEHYNKYNEVNLDGTVNDINQYYDELISTVNTRSVLSVFSENNSFYTINELKGFMGVLFSIFNEFMEAYPYLFEIVDNRISLVHDSFNTYLRDQLNNITCPYNIKEEVYNSLLNGNVEYMARIMSFRMEENQLSELLKKYADFKMLRHLISNTLDYNSIADFYNSLRRYLETRPGVLDIYQYYAFTLIFQIVLRNDLVGYESLIYQILQYLNDNYDIENHIYSTGIVWNVYLACEGRSDKLNNYMQETRYGDSQLGQAYDDINEEIDFFDCIEKLIDVKKLHEHIKANKTDGLKKSDMLQKYLEIIWIQKECDMPLYKEFDEFIVSGDSSAIHRALRSEYGIDSFWVERTYKSANYRLHELGYFEDNNMFRNDNLYDLIHRKAPEGSFHVMVLVLSFLRLANHENRKTDIYNINYAWSMYSQRKDYSVHTIDTALIVFENEGLITEDDSLDMINRLMKQSEKGIRHLLSSYINEKGSEYTKRLVDTRKIYDPELRLDYFDLNPECINVLPQYVIEQRIEEYFNYHYISNNIDGYDIKNLIRSKYCKILTDALDYFNKNVNGGLGKEEIEILQVSGIEYYETANVEYKNKEYVPFEHGNIHMEDFDYIKQSGMTVMECSKYADGWYECLPYVELYELFDRKEIKDNYLEIIHQALFARVINNEYIGNWNDIIGNIPLFLEKYEIDVDWKRLFDIFLSFLKYSVIYYPDYLAVDE